jgi:hypothetical protein
MGDLAATERLLDDATAMLRRAGPWFLSRVLYGRAMLAMRRGEVDRAIMWLDERTLATIVLQMIYLHEQG